MEQFECFWGTCPHYRVSIDKSGSVTYVGIAAVKTEGLVQLQIPQSAFDKISQEIARIRYFDLRAKYVSKADGCKEIVSDQSSVKFIVTRGDEKKEVILYYGCRTRKITSRLAGLADLVDNVTGIGPLLGRGDAP